MKYYKVKQESDNVTHNKGFLVANELYTEKELDKLNLSGKFIELNFDKVEISKFKTYWLFGARFELS